MRVLHTHFHSVWTTFPSAVCKSSLWTHSLAICFLNFISSIWLLFWHWLTDVVFIWFYFSFYDCSGCWICIFLYLVIWTLSYEKCKTTHYIEHSLPLMWNERLLIKTTIIIEQFLLDIIAKKIGVYFLYAHWNIHCQKSKEITFGFTDMYGVGEMPHWLNEFDAFSEILSSSLSTHMAVHSW